ncbi:MAG: hypothetical protein WCO52_04930 [bacterium]
MTDTQKEHLLHKLIASSAFLFALCILPVAQYLLVSGQVTSTATKTGGQVLGASTDSTIINADVPSLSCQEAKTKDLNQLEVSYYQPTLAKWQADEDTAASALEGELVNLKVDPATTQAQLDALSAQIEATKAPFETKIAQLTSAVESQKNEIESRACSAE